MSCDKGKSLQFSNVNYDFKKVTAGTSVQAKYLFKNISNRAIRIESVSTQCDCIVPEKKQFIVEPGATGSLSVIFVASKQLQGKQKREIVVRTNDEPTFYFLSMSGTVVGEQTN
jgi:predicted amino acid dehydrogenase